MKKIILFVSLVLVLVVGFLYFNNLDNKVVSYLRISINPDLEFALNEKEEVVEIIALNEDAFILLADKDLEGKPIEEVLDLLVDDSIELGFINELNEENIIEVMMINEDEEIRESLEQKVMARIEGRLSEKKVAAVLSAVKLTDDLKEQAEEFGVSNGKMLLIEQAIFLNDTLVKEDLVDLSIQNIQREIKESLDKGKLDKEELLEKRQELKNEQIAKVNQFKEEIKTRIENFNSLNEEAKENAINEEMEQYRIELKERALELEKEVEEIKKENSQINVPGEIREIIRNRRN
jgi:hypothetical protein